MHNVDIDNKSITVLLKDAVIECGYKYWGCEVVKEVGGILIKLYMDKKDGVNLNDCEIVSRKINKNEKLCELDNLRLEVSSPGINRTLFYLYQYEMYIGSKANIKLTNKIEGRKKFVGEISGVNDQSVQFCVDSQSLEIPFDNICRAKLIA